MYETLGFRLLLEGEGSRLNARGGFCFFQDDLFILFIKTEEEGALLSEIWGCIKKRRRCLFMWLIMKMSTLPGYRTQTIFFIILILKYNIYIILIKLLKHI